MDMQSGRHRRDVESFDSSRSTADSWSWVVAFAVFLIQLTIPCSLSSYGVLLARLVEDKNWFLWSGLLPPVFYIASWYFADPICKKAVSGQSPNARYTAMIGILVVSGGIAVNTLLESVLLQIFTYGILGGVGTSLVVAQAEAVLSSHFPSQRGLVQAVCHVSMALGQFGMPLLLNGFISLYGSRGALLLQAGVVLHAVIGAILLLPPGQGTPTPSYYARPRAYTLIDDMELADLSSNYSHTGTSPLLPKRRQRNTTHSGYIPVQPGSPINMLRHKNINGVEILPEIPEESESEESETDNSDVFTFLASSSPVCRRSTLSSKRMGSRTKEDGVGEDKEHMFKKNTCESNQNSNRSPLQKWQSINLQSEVSKESNGINSCEVKSESQTTAVVLEAVSLNVSKESDEDSLNSLNSEGYKNNFQFLMPAKRHSRTTFHPPLFQSLRKLLRCRCCNWYCRYKFYVSVLNVPNNILMCVIIPLWTALKVPKFAPALFLHAALKLCPTMFAALTPSLTRKYVPDSSPQEAAFTVSVAAFSWLCFLLMSPCFSEMKPKKQKYIYLAGCLVSACGLYLLSMTDTHGSIIMGCAFFGIGHGAAVSTGPVFLEDDLGIGDYLRIQGSLDGVSGCFVLLFSVLFGTLLQHQNGLSYCFMALAVLQTLTGLIWILTLVKPLLDKIHRLHSSISEWTAGGDFLTPG